MRIFSLVLTLALIAPPPVLAASGRLGSFGAWEAAVSGDGPSKVCFATAAAAKSQGGEKGRAPTSVSVTHRAKSQGEISLTAPYGFKAKADIEVMVAAMKHTFFSQGNSAWAKEAAADKALIQAMSKGRELVIKAAPAKGSAVIDTVPLSGFGQALAAIDKACGVKR